MHRVVCIALAVLLVATATPSRAAPSGKAAAKKHFRLGKRLSKKKRYRAAIGAFHRAYKHWSHRVILFNIAMCHAWLGEKVIAGRYVRRFLKEARGRERTLPPLLESVFQATAELTLVSSDPRASLHVDGRRVGQGRATLVVLAGQRVLEVRSGNRILARTELAVRGGGVARWAPPIRTVLSRPRTRTQPVPRPRPTPGPGVTPPIDRRPSARRLHWAWFTTFTGLAAGLAAGAVVMGFRTKDLRDRFLANRTDASLRSDAVQAMTVTNVLWGVAGASAITAAILAIFTRWKRTERPAGGVAVTPVVTRAGAGLQLTWTR